ncbi:MAG: hypothetical protein LBD54_00305 [Puniceicoccales bacterium]|jgi:hypothetical protein|nr:hypothetical protein [Puniceicoccales bacterium]
MMKRLPLLLTALLILGLNACSSSRSRETAIPWARPSPWEASPLPMMGGF